MTAKIIEGQPVAERLRAEVTAEVAHLRAEHGLQPGLAVVLVGDDPASQAYVKSKGEQSLAAGMHSVTHRLPADTTQAALEALVADLAADPAIHGILVQLPLPAHLDETPVIATEADNLCGQFSAQAFGNRQALDDLSCHRQSIP